MQCAVNTQWGSIICEEEGSRSVAGKSVQLEVIMFKKNRSISERKRSHLLSFSFMDPRFYKDRQNYVCTHTHKHGMKTEVQLCWERRN